MKYYALLAERAAAALESTRSGVDVDNSEVSETRGSGEMLDVGVFSSLGKQLHAAREGFAERLRSKDPAGGKYETIVCSYIHQCLPFDPRMLADLDFWAWLAVTQFWAIVDWRHGGEMGQASPANFGIGGGTENLFYRMWLRADIGYDPSRADAYELARRGDQDFWRSHLFRQGYGRCRQLARSLIRYQFPDSSPTVPRLKILEIRELAKRLKRLDSNLVFDYLDEADTSRVVEREAENARRTISRK
jgi:hypothetical protein